jgi:hypothetical protein
MLPRAVHVERSVDVARPPAAVFPLVNSLHGFNQWSPWNGLDPQMKLDYSGPDSGVGAQMQWSGDKRVGSGRERITESVPDTRVTSDLEFTGQGTAKASFLLAPIDGGTRVVWTLDMDVGSNPIGRYMGLFMDKMIGPDYERGLASLKALAEREPAATPPVAATPPTG